MKKYLSIAGLLIILAMGIVPHTEAQIGSLTRRFIGIEDIYFATGGTGAVETFNYVDPSHNILTLHKLDASYIKFRTAQGGLPASLEELVNGSNTVNLFPKDLSVAGNATITGTSTFTGLSTFTAIPVGPNLDPSTGDQLTRKLYVDTQVAAAQAAAIAASVTLTGNQTVAGIKTFSSFPVTPSSAPTTDYQVVNKKYIDDMVGTLVQTVNYQTGAVSTGTTVMPLDDTIPQKTEGDEYMTLAITPTSATNLLHIRVVANVTASAAVSVVGALFQDTTANALAASYAVTTPQLIIDHWMVAGTTSATTFKVRVGPNSAATITFNGAGAARLLGGVSASSITITETKP